MKIINISLFLFLFLFSKSLSQQTDFQTKVYYAINKIMPSVMEIETKHALGSGFYIGDGLIITNKHVVNANERLENFLPAEKIIARNPSSRSQFSTKVIYTDEDIDFVILKIQNLPIDKIDIQPAELGNSDTLKVGQYVIAVGSPLGYTSSVTQGIVSGLFRYHRQEKNRKLQPNELRKIYIQIDAVIDPGNSGGPLVNLDGQVIGINTLTDFDIRGRGKIIMKSGINFSIPINFLKPFIKYATTDQKYYSNLIGFDTDSLITELEPSFTDSIIGVPGAIQFKVVTPNFPLWNAGVRARDVIYEIKNQKILSLAHFIYLISTLSWNDTVQIKYYRPGKKQFLDSSIRIGRRLPDELLNRILDRYPFQANGGHGYNNHHIQAVGTLNSLVSVFNEEEYIEQLARLYLTNELFEIYIQYSNQTAQEARPIRLENNFGR